MNATNFKPVFIMGTAANPNQYATNMITQAQTAGVWAGSVVTAICGFLMIAAIASYVIHKHLA